MHESQQIAAERRDLAAHTHRSAAEQRGKEDHPTGHESSRQHLEHSNMAYLEVQTEHQKIGAEPANNGIVSQDIAMRAYKLWQDRGCPAGAPEEDWFRAIEELKIATSATHSH